MVIATRGSASRARTFGRDRDGPDQETVAVPQIPERNDPRVTVERGIGKTQHWFVMKQPLRNRFGHYFGNIGHAFTTSITSQTLNLSAERQSGNASR
jgi:hypothetical protein